MHVPGFPGGTSSEDDVAFYPVAVDSVTNLGDFEQEVARILESVYDNAIGFSLRDRDDSLRDGLSDVEPVRRFRLNCRAAENLLLSDQVLESVKGTWGELKSRIATWISNNPSHPHHPHVSAFAATANARRSADLKEIRNDLVGLMGSKQTVGDSRGPSNRSHCGW